MKTISKGKAAKKEALCHQEAEEWLEGLRTEAKKESDTRRISNAPYAKNFLELVKHHKQNCNSDDCPISLSLLKPIYMCCVMRECTPEELKCFI